LIARQQSDGRILGIPKKADFSEPLGEYLEGGQVSFGGDVASKLGSASTENIQQFSIT